ncbi:hypothetical protein AG1IA_10175 [Rhizoctonia solani AG-1 IA]|uniref:Uncharacterized protein n=1 Tax=Thanatephorus cucumeris (strain AG1-IA) TaxID=983506 RepID=L8WCY3_THACA|nr:hypothetical protein AG1IA_10175 [Rhizoctonia solani AG-1 IA]
MALVSAVTTVQRQNCTRSTQKGLRKAKSKPANLETLGVVRVLDSAGRASFACSRASVADTTTAVVLGDWSAAVPLGRTVALGTTVLLRTVTVVILLVGRGARVLVTGAAVVAAGEASVVGAASVVGTIVELGAATVELGLLPAAGTGPMPSWPATAIDDTAPPGAT